MSQREVVITGMGIVCPVGNNVNDAWENILKGQSGVRKITQFDTTDFLTKIAGIVVGFNAEDYISPKQIKKMDSFTHYAIAAAKQAWKEAKLEDSDYYQKEKMGCILGIGMGGLPYLERYHKAYLEGGTKKISPFLIPALVTNLAPGHIGIELGLKGVNYSIASACSSSTHAIGEAYRMVKSGLQDVMVTGGAESTIVPTAVGGFGAMKALSTRNDEPEKASRPFDRDRDGFVIGEGGACLILEELEHAKKRGATIYAKLSGYGFSCDAFHMTAPKEDGEGAVACMKMAIENAGIKEEDVDYINAHGTSTHLNDIIETRAIKEVFKDHAYKLSVSSTKSMTGHLLGGAGAIEAVFSAMAVKNNIVPPTINLDNPDEGCDLDYTPYKPKEREIKYALSNSFGFGGTNASIIIGKF